MTTIDIFGFETATFNGEDVFGAFNLGLQTEAYTGIGNLTTFWSILGTSQTAEPTYALATATTFTGAATNTNGTYSTTLGDLITTGKSGNATFTAAAVPEPSAFALLGLGTVGLVARRRRVA